MSDVKYRFGYNEDGKIVSIDELNQSNKHDNIFRCLSCDCILTPKIGKVRVPHFSHKPNVNCNNESYLHKLTKHLLIQKFNNSSEFRIKFLRKKGCSDSSQCRFVSPVCTERSYEDFDLKEFYDTCREEVSIDDFRSDILISDSTGRYKDPVLIEIYCSHKSSREKLESGLRIIEIKIDSEEDVLKLINEDITEDHKVKFVGFNRKSVKEHDSGCVNISRFVLYKSGEVDILDSVSCRDRNVKYDEDSRLELNIIPFGWEMWRCVLEWGMVKSLDMGYKFKNCLLCKHHDLFGPDQPLLCRLNLLYNTPQYPKQTECNNCSYYEVDYLTIRMVRESMSLHPIGIVGED